MYTGTLINDLMNSVERAEQRAERLRIALETELRTIYAMQIPLPEGDQVLTGAA